MVKLGVECRPLIGDMLYPQPPHLLSRLSPHLWPLGLMCYAWYTPANAPLRSLPWVLSLPGINTFLPHSYGSLLHFLIFHILLKWQLLVRPWLTTLPKIAPLCLLLIPFILFCHFLTWMTLNIPQGGHIYSIRGLSPCTRLWGPGGKRLLCLLLWCPVL